jgi:peptidyl-prolyl cis-trans isomerase SurA
MVAMRRGTCSRAVLLSACSFAVLAGGCRSTPAAPPPVSADTWAVVDGREIRLEEVEKAYRRTAPPDSVPSDEEALTAKLVLLNDLIVQNLLVAKAAELKIEVSDAELDKAYNDNKKNLPDDQFEQELTRRKLTAADMRDGLRRDMLTQKVLEREVQSKVTVTDQDIADFFAANRAQFNRTEDAYHIAQIVVTPVKEPQVVNRSGNDAATPQDAGAKIQMLVGRLKEGTAFSDLAADFSEDPESAPRGGDLGFVPVSALQRAPASLRDAVLKSKPGSVQVVTINGTHTIVLVLSHEAAGQRDPGMPEVRERITAALRNRREQLLREAYLGALRSDATVVNHIARLVIAGQGKTPSLAPTAPGR